MASGDPADTHGHTHAEAAAQEPTLDLGEDPGSDPDQDYAGLGPNDSVLAQSAAEVAAQIANEPG